MQWGAALLIGRVVFMKLVLHQLTRDGNGLICSKAYRCSCQHIYFYKLNTLKGRSFKLWYSMVALIILSYGWLNFHKDSRPTFWRIKVRKTCSHGDKNIINSEMKTERNTEVPTWTSWIFGCGKRGEESFTFLPPGVAYVIEVPHMD